MLTSVPATQRSFQCWRSFDRTLSPFFSQKITVISCNSLAKIEGSFIARPEATFSRIMDTFLYFRYNNSINTKLHSGILSL